MSPTLSNSPAPPPASSSSSTMVLSSNFVRSSFIFIFIATLIMSHIEISTAKSLGLAFQDDFWSETPPKFSKRNSWWSKKSLDSAPKYQKLLQDSDLFDNEKLPEEQSAISDSNPGDNSNLYDCYTQLCVPDFVGCTQKSRSNSKYNECKAAHRLCALQCWVQSTEMNVAGI